MKALFLSLLLAAAAVAQQQDSITLDPAAMSEVWAQVSGGVAVPGEPVIKLNPPGNASETEWSALFREARQSVNAATFPVLVLSLMQQLNPQLPMDKNVWTYAAALELHRQAFSGTPRACVELSAALRSGQLGGLTYFTDAALAAEVAALAQPQPEGQTGTSE